eukprot:CAMPEP_0116130474 /NCGR_PEP_ID=MMETSP0329-20121206/8500_1 /TAXON_ID=697910 /ORGANISM="Pseudo-nitzschia arenysensis, Strain B593" /LENGTH=298 /DNA_ID=CAMNT_0003624857 /DNA_START=225 /DNA_END=1121 /DNA_ORIENTATION=-
MVFTFSRAQFEALALQLAGYSNVTIARTNRETNTDRLKDFCYAGKKTLEKLYVDIQDPALGEHQIRNPNPADLIHALYFLKKYPTAHEFSGRCGTGTEKTVLNKAWRYIHAIQALKGKKIKWIFDENNNDYFILSVDGVHCRIHEPRTQPSSGWYSKKFNKAGLTYELGVAIYHNKIVWINGPFPAGQNDIKVFRKPGGLMSKIPDDCRAIGDEGYRGEPTKVSTRNTFNSVELKEFENRVRARHETVNSRLKAFGVLNQVFRSKGRGRMMEKHKSAFEACCVIVQYELDNGSKLFKV